VAANLQEIGALDASEDEPIFSKMKVNLSYDILL
jgi:hypothetical protein